MCLSLPVNFIYEILLLLLTADHLQAHVEYETAKRHYAHVDCPGHADYVKVSYKFNLFIHELGDWFLFEIWLPG